MPLPRNAPRTVLHQELSDLLDHARATDAAGVTFDLHRLGAIVAGIEHRDGEALRAKRRLEALVDRIHEVLGNDTASAITKVSLIERAVRR